MDPRLASELEYAASRGQKEKKIVDIKVDKTFTFTEESIRAILVDYLQREHQVEVKPEDFKLDISDSTRGGYYDNEFIPAKLKGFSVTIKTDG